MNSKLKNVLHKINFVPRYEKLSLKFPIPATSWDWEIGKIEAILKPFGYKFSYNKKHKFFKVDDAKDNPFGTSLHLVFPYGNVEFILNITIDGEGDGGPFGFICELLDVPEIIKKPKFNTLDELSEILKEGFSIYEDIKSNLR